MAPGGNLPKQLLAPVADGAEARHEYGIELVPWEALPRADAIVAAVAQRQFVAKSLAHFLERIVDNGCFMDVKSQFDMAALRKAGLTVWRLCSAGRWIPGIRKFSY